MIRWERFDLDLPDDFPVAAVDSLHAYLSDRDADAPTRPEWKEWSTGLNGLVFRFRACDENGEAVVASLAAGNSPPMPDRYFQERDLFSFFFHGLSAIECLTYGVYFVGSLADPIAFPSDINPRDVVPRLVQDTFTTHTAFGSHRIAKALDALTSADDFKEWGKIRNFLGHRGAPGRTFYEGGIDAGRVDWELPIAQVNIPKILQQAEIQRRRDWLGDQIGEICESAHAFAVAHVP